MLLITEGSAPEAISECLYSTYTLIPVSNWAVWAMWTSVESTKKGACT